MEHEGGLTTTTPNPEWFVSLEKRSDSYLQGLTEDLQIIKDIQQNTLDLQKVQQFLTQVGRGIIVMFPEWLNNMIDRTPRQSLHFKYLRANRLEERSHWQWWIDMAKAYNVKREDFDTPLKPGMEQFSNYLTDRSKNAPLEVAMAGINYVVETGAAETTKVIANQVLPDLQKRNPNATLWIKAHAEGDILHSADSKELIKSLVGDSKESAQSVTEEVDLVYPMYKQALQEAYS